MDLRPKQVALGGGNFLDGNGLLRRFGGDPISDHGELRSRQRQRAECLRVDSAQLGRRQSRRRTLPYQFGSDDPRTRPELSVRVENCVIGLPPLLGEQVKLRWI